MDLYLIVLQGLLASDPGVLRGYFRSFEIVNFEESPKPVPATFV